MNIRAKLSAYLKDYPYQQLWTVVATLIGVYLLTPHVAIHFTLANIAVFGALFVAVLSGKGRPFWFFYGVAIGGTFVRLAGGH